MQPEWFMVGISLFLVFIAACQALIYWQMLHTSRRTDRAWVVVADVTIEGDRDGTPVVVVWLKNAGRSPAIIKNANVTVLVSDRVNGRVTAVDELPDEPRYDSSSVVPPPILAPNESAGMRLRIGGAGPDGRYFGFRRINQSGGATAWVYGWVRYTNGLDAKDRLYKWARASRAVAGEPTLVFVHVNKDRYHQAE